MTVPCGKLFRRYLVAAGFEEFHRHGRWYVNIPVGHLSQNFSGFRMGGQDGEFKFVFTKLRLDPLPPACGFGLYYHTPQLEPADRVAFIKLEKAIFIGTNSQAFRNTFMNTPARTMSLGRYHGTRFEKINPFCFNLQNR